MGTFTKDNVTKDEVLDMMAGGAEMQTLMNQLEGIQV
jgi:simple sugar transport system ATP-binding protein